VWPCNQMTSLIFQGFHTYCSCTLPWSQGTLNFMLPGTFSCICSFFVCFLDGVLSLENGSWRFYVTSAHGHLLTVLQNVSKNLCSPAVLANTSNTIWANVCILAACTIWSLLVVFITISLLPYSWCYIILGIFRVLWWPHCHYRQHYIPLLFS
jgi:hypothetical protein